MEVHLLELRRRFLRWRYRHYAMCECGKTSVHDTKNTRPVYWKRNPKVIIAVCCDLCQDRAKAITDSGFGFSKLEARRIEAVK